MPAAFLTLIRWKNLLLLALTQIATAAAMQLWVALDVRPSLWLLAGMMAISTMLIAAAGYLVNDWCDVEIDRINKPGAPLPSGRFPMKAVLPWYAALNVAGLGLAGWAWMSIGSPAGLALQLLSIWMLWQYSRTWKRRFMIGNAAVALLSALAVVAVKLVIELGAGLRRGGDHRNLYAFALFAFLLTWVREIVKDLEDREGDAAQGCRTMAIRWSLRANVFFAISLLFLALMLMFVLLLIGFLGIGYGEDPRLLIASALLCAGLYWLMTVMERMTTRAHFARASRLIKILMAAGIAAVLWLSL